MKTITQTNTKNEFPYNVNRWPVNKNVRKPLVEIALDAIDMQLDLMISNKPDKLGFPVGSPINKFSAKQQVELLNRLESAIRGLPFAGNQEEDLILEELLHTLLTGHVEYIFDMAGNYDDDDDLWEVEINKIKKVYQLDTGDKKAKREDVIQWFDDAIWWDMDWQIFEIDTKKYKELYFAPLAKR
jgi:hypothetical protein